MGRALAVAASAAIGLGGLIAFAAPASAHAALLTATPVCDTTTGDYVITWGVGNDWAGIVTLDTVNASPTAITNIVDGAVVPPKVGRVNGTISGEQRVPGTATSANLRLTAKWSDGYSGSANKTVPLAGTCAPDAPPPPPAPVCVDATDAAFTHTFDGPAGTATITMADLPLCAGQSQTFALVSYTTAGDGALPQERFDDATGVLDAALSTLTLAVDVPLCTSALYLVWGSETLETITTTEPYPTTILGGSHAPGSRSTGPLGTHTGGTATCTAPAATFAPACDTTTTITLTNAATAVRPATMTVNTTTGHTATATIKPGDTTTLTVPANTGAITITTGNSTIAEYTWTNPAICVTPEPTETAPEPTTEAPKPTTEAPKPTTEAPKPTTEAPKPTTEAPKPTTEAPKPTTEAPKPTTEAPKPTTEAPKPTTEAPKPTTNPIGGGAGKPTKPTATAPSTAPASASAIAPAPAMAPANAPIPATVSTALAVTGQAIWVTATAGFALMLFGALFLLVSRRRPHRTN